MGWPRQESGGSTSAHVGWSFLCADAEGSPLRTARGGAQLLTALTPLSCLGESGHVSVRSPSSWTGGATDPRSAPLGPEVWRSHPRRPCSWRACVPGASGARVLPPEGSPAGSSTPGAGARRP